MYKACVSPVLLLILVVMVRPAAGGLRQAPLRAVLLMAGSESQAPTPTSGPKVIGDPAEYRAYMSAFDASPPAQKAAAMEAFVQQYPNSVMRMEALEQALAAYQQGGNQAKVAEMLEKILKANPDHVRALAIAAFLKRYDKSPQAPAEARSVAQRGLQAMSSWQQPNGMPDAEFETLRRQMAAIFHGACGYGAFQAKDYAAARECFLQAVQEDPGHAENNYQLALAGLEMTPPDSQAFWYLARAANLYKTTTPTLGDYARSRYKRYHGSEDGWQQLLTRTATETAPPAGFSVKPAPTAAETAVLVVAQNDPAALSFADWEYVLSYRDASAANGEAANKVWAAIRKKEQNGAVKLRIPVMVVTASANTIAAAITEENQQASPLQADLLVTMEKPMANPPAPGSMIEVIGVISDYIPKPFHFVMTKGELPAAKPVNRKP